MEKEQKIGKINVATSIPQDVWELAKKNEIAWNKALILGIEILTKKKEKKEVRR